MVSHANLQGRLDRAGRLYGIVGAADRAADHQHARAIVAGLSGGNGAFLVTRIPASRAQAGDDEEAVFPLAMRSADFLPRTHDAVEARGMSQFGQPHDMVVGSAADALLGEVAFVQAGQHGDGHDFRAFPRRRLRVLQHGAPAAGVDGNDRGFQQVDRLHRAGDRVGNIVELEVEENGQAQLRDVMHPVRSMRAEEFQPELQPADMVLHLFRQRLRRVQLRQVEREIDGIAHRWTVTGGMPAASSRKVVSPPCGGVSPGERLPCPACDMAAARAAFSRFLIRRSRRQVIAR